MKLDFPAILYARVRASMFTDPCQQSVNLQNRPSIECLQLQNTIFAMLSGNTALGYKERPADMTMHPQSKRTQTNQTCDRLHHRRQRTHQLLLQVVCHPVQCHAVAELVSYRNLAGASSGGGCQLIIHEHHYG